MMTAEVVNFKIWKTFKLGTHQYVDELSKTLEVEGHKIGNWAKDILSKPALTISPSMIEINLVVVSGHELGIRRNATRKAIFDQGLQLSLKLCPSEVGPQGRRQYQNQPMDEALLVAMEPIIDSVGNPKLFLIERIIDGSWLRGHNGQADYFWDPHRRWIFWLDK